ncbi:MAG: DUF4412 domain-containing protein [Nitrospirae bacterium]|nr:DUF4412 domain-containing protein [Candidatus Manganitrophaceae bacterium]
MNFVKQTLRALLLTWVSFGASWAAELPEPKVEYSADSVVEAEQMTLKATIYHALDKERREQEKGSMKQVLILRKDKNLAWMLMPEQKMYMEMPSTQAKNKEIDLSNYKIERTEVGKEVVEGVDTTKSKVVMTGADGASFDGFLWTTPEGITMKMDAVAQGKGEKSQIKMTLKNLKIAKQDPALFEIPAGYHKMPVNPFGGMGKAPGSGHDLDERMNEKK